jgi:hypothetical protein
MTMKALKLITKVLLADATTAPIIQLIDGPGILNKRYLAPKAKSQEKMNSYFCGTGWSLANQLSNMTKTVFVTLFNSGLNPFGYTLCAFAQFFAFWVDKYCIFRIWEQQPAMGDDIIKKNRAQIALAVLIHMIITLHFYASWPFDGLCLKEGHEMVEYTDTAKELNVTDFRLYKPCKGEQQYNGFIAEVQAYYWMSDDQKKILGIYRPATIVMTVALIVIYFGRELYLAIDKLVAGTYSPRGAMGGKKFSECKGMEAYFPTIKVKGYPFPLLACSLDKCDRDHIAFTADHHAYNLDSEADLPGMSTQDREVFFSQVRMYPPGNEPKLTYPQYLEKEAATLWKKVKPLYEESLKEDTSGPRKSDMKLVTAALKDKDQRAKL